MLWCGGVAAGDCTTPPYRPGGGRGQWQCSVVSSASDPAPAPAPAPAQACALQPSTLTCPQYVGHGLNQTLTDDYAYHQTIPIYTLAMP